MTFCLQNYVFGQSWCSNSRRTSPPEQPQNGVMQAHAKSPKQHQDSRLTVPKKYPASAERCFPWRCHAYAYAPKQWRTTDPLPPHGAATHGPTQPREAPCAPRSPVGKQGRRIIMIIFIFIQFSHFHYQYQHVSFSFAPVYSSEQTA